MFSSYNPKWNYDEWNRICYEDVLYEYFWELLLKEKL